VLSSFISDAISDTSTSPNYAYILFEASALTLSFSKSDQKAFSEIEENLTPAISQIIEQNVSDYLGYAFQIYATFIANSTELKQHYEVLCKSVIENLDNWGKELKYLTPALTILVTTVICKYPDYARSKLANLQ